MITIKQANDILGNKAKWELQAMKKALEMLQFLNTDKDNKRLQAVNILLNDIK